MENIRNVAVIFCNWKRSYRLNILMNDLMSQSYDDFDIFIWNNNYSDMSNIDDMIKKYDKKISVINSIDNIGGIGRFYYARKIANTYKKIIFIDDDQKLGEDVLEKMLKLHKDRSILSWWGWLVGDSYFNRSRVTNFTNVNYCGTGGMIIDSDIFKTIDLTLIPEKYKFIEDLWLSFVAKYDYGYDLYGGDFDIKILNDGNDQFNKLIPLKIEFFKYLKSKYE